MEKEYEFVGRVIKSSEASNDLLEIWDYIADSSETAADRMLDEINQKLRLLSDFPHMGRERTEIDLGVRSFTVKNYVIFYAAMDDGIEVIRVIRGARDIENIF
jgi:toxin ParE1/3/4